MQLKQERDAAKSALDEVSTARDAAVAAEKGAEESLERVMNELAHTQSILDCVKKITLSGGDKAKVCIVNMPYTPD